MNFSKFLASFKFPHSAAQSASVIVMATVAALSFWRGEGSREVPKLEAKLSNLEQQLADSSCEVRTRAEALEERTKRLEQSQTVTPSGESSGRR
jgi:hypothetical protein